MHIDWSKVDFGSLPDWIAAAAASVAFIVAIFATWATIRTNRAQQLTLDLQRRQLADAQEQAKRAQAEKVSFWLSDSLDSIRVANASDLPIHDVDIVSLVGDNAEAQVLSLVDVVAPTGANARRIRFENRRPDTCNQMLLIAFRDAAGNHWTRDERGGLTEIADRFVIESDDESESESEVAAGG